MAQTMKDIKRRIGSIGNIMQITNAMELVSSAKLRKARANLETTKPYFGTVYRNINEILSVSRDNTSVFLKKRPVKKRAVLVFAGDRGLAGGYNINVVKEAMKHNKDDVETIFFPTGNRAIEILSRAGCNLDMEFNFIDEDPHLDDAVELGNYILDKYAEEAFDEVLLVYTVFKTVLQTIPTTIKLLPATGFNEDSNNNSDEEVRRYVPIEYEPSPEIVLTQMIRQYVNVTIYGSLLESAASEQAARRTAMENATDNGEELLGDLQLVYNRARQASITQEITEIVGGAEALK